MPYLITLLFLGFSLSAFSNAPRFMCHLSIMDSKGASSQCNAVAIGGKKILTAAHCFPEGIKTITHGVVLAKCGDTEIDEFVDLQKSNRVSSGKSEDFAVLVTKSVSLPGDILPTRYSSMYFSSDRLKPGVQCEVLALRGKFPSANLVRILMSEYMVLNTISSTQIVMKKKAGSALNDQEALIEGDSGGALICRYSKNAKPELIGVISNYGSTKIDKIKIQNAFSPVFGSEALRILQ
jgi:hypothetical protein